jgi:hypothetical protein
MRVSQDTRMPMARSTAISFICSTMFVYMLDTRLKKQITITMNVANRKK